MSLIQHINHNKITLPYVPQDFKNGLIVIELNISKWIKLKMIIQKELKFIHVMQFFMKLPMHALMICLISLWNQHILEDRIEHLNIIISNIKCVDFQLCL
ncbi:unnamed protein product [Paramecium sonneborni]|uniref:Uncharacterized protein n=1 Tax=Paramecium sonneborni TaxID=65129 RepID=A0A8S1KYY9_9CILI|nr:unnamed protein product [Paramecium sonneborni]